MTTLIVEILNFIINRIIQFPKISTTNFPHYTRFGTQYGGWWVDNKVLQDSELTKILISCGLGTDLSFDVEMQRNGFHVIGVDPIAKYVICAQEILGLHFVGIPKAVSASNNPLPLYPPRSPDYDSWSTVTPERSIDPIYFDAITISDILKISLDIEPGRSHFVYLKLDIEGAEENLFNLIAESQVDFVAVELDFISLLEFRKPKANVRSVLKMRQIMKLMKRSGYQFIFSEGFNYYWRKNS